MEIAAEHESRKRKQTISTRNQKRLKDGSEDCPEPKSKKGKRASNFSTDLGTTGPQGGEQRELGTTGPQGGEQRELLAATAEDEDYYTIKVKVGHDRGYEYVYLGTSDPHQRLFYGPPIHPNKSTLFHLTRGKSGGRISNYVTHSAGVFARLKGDDIVLDEKPRPPNEESPDFDFTIEKCDEDTTIFQTVNSKKVMWYPTDGMIKAKVFDDGPGPLFKVEKVLPTMNILSIEDVKED